MKASVRKSTGKTIHRRGQGHSVNRGALKSESFALRGTLKSEILCAYSLPKTQLLLDLGTKQRDAQDTIPTKLLRTDLLLEELTSITDTDLDLQGIN